MRLFQKDESTAAKRDIFVQMVDENDFVTAETGLTLTVEIVKAGESEYGAIEGSSAEIGSGTYRISLAAADLDTLGEGMLKITADGAAAQFVPFQVATIADDLTAVKADTEATLADTDEIQGKLPTGDMADATDLATVADDAHYAKAALVNNRTHEESTGVDVIYDDDGTTPLLTVTPVADITFDGGDWTNSTKRLIVTGAFATYIWASGDKIVLTAGTGVVTGEYTIASKVDNDTLELVEDINGEGADVADGSIEGYISNGKIMVTVA